MFPLLLLPILYAGFPPTCTCFLPLSVVFTYRRHFSVLQRCPDTVRAASVSGVEPGQRFCPTPGRVRSSCTTSWSRNVEHAALTNLASNGTVVSLSKFARGRGAHFVHRCSACVCLFPASVGCLHELHAGFLFHNDTADICQCEMPRHRDRPMRRPVNTKAVMAEKRSHVRSREDRTTNCLDRGTFPTKARRLCPSLVQTQGICGRCGQDIEMPGPALPVPRTSLRQTVSRQNSSPEWMDEDDLLEDERCADDGPFQERFFSCRSPSPPTATHVPTIQGNLMSTLCPSWKVPDQ